MAHLGSSEHTVTLPSGTNTVSFSADLYAAGAGNKIVFATVYFRPNQSHVVSGVTAGGESMSGGTEVRAFMCARRWRLATSLTSTQTVELSVNSGGTTSSCQVVIDVYDALDISARTETTAVTTDTGIGGTSSITASTAAGETVLTSHCIRVGYPSPASIASDTFDVRGEGNDGSNLTIITGDLIAAGATEAMSITWAGLTGNVSTYVLAESYEAAAGGPVTHEAAVAFDGTATLGAAAFGRRAAAAIFAGTGTLAPAATVRRRASTAFAGAGTFAGVATARRAGAVTFQGVGTFAAAVGGSVLQAAVAFSGAGSATFAAHGIRHAAATFSGAATLSGAARRILGAVATFAGTATLTPTARALRAAAVAFSGAGTFDATAFEEAVEVAYQGKYASEHASAFRDLGAVSDFSAEHASAFRDLGAA